MNNNKKKITTVVLLLAFLAIAVTGGTLAYFTDTDSATHTYTAGNVAIDLTEGAVAKNNSGNYEFIDRVNNRIDVGDNEQNVYDFGKLYPAMTIDKDPTITNLGSEDAYVAAKITVNDGNGDIERILGTGYNGLIGIQKMVSGGYVKENDTMKSYNGLAPVYGDSTYSVYQQIENGEYVFYIFVEDPIAEDEKVVLFEKLSIPKEWDNDEMKEFKNLSITIDAFAVQAYGFNNCFDAMTTAFGGQNGEFNFN